MGALRLSAVALLLASSGCIELVEDGEAGAGGGRASDDQDDEAPDVALTVESRQKGRVDVTLIASDRAAFDLADQNATGVTLSGFACRNTDAGGDSTWQVGEVLLFTSQTPGCGIVVRSGSNVTVAVRIEGFEVMRSQVLVR